MWHWKILQRCDFIYDLYANMTIHPLWAVCLVLRAVLARAVYRWHGQHSLAMLLMVIGTGFIVKGYFGSDDEEQIGPVFWHSTRYAHGILFVLSSLYLVSGDRMNASLLILTDIAYSVLNRIITDK